MLFNSYIFIFCFLPITLIGFYFINGQFPRWTPAWLTASSLFFYGWWNPIYLSLLISSLLFNYCLSLYLIKNNHQRNSFFLAFGISVNLLSIIYFKYTLFLANNLLPHHYIPNFIQHIVLPLAISFFTFEQISYLIDIWRGEIKPEGFFKYAAFLSFFPHLIAGPIVRYQELVPQFKKHTRVKYFNGLRLISIGGTIFLIGLFKKTCLADTLSLSVNNVFEAANNHYDISFIDAWLGILAYTFQLYFDFSGYSDMAIGLGYMFGIKLPINFYSPYKALSIIDFWRRWHISLSRFFRDYLYIPLGGNRKGKARHYIHLFIVMALVGLWHGANWTFILWGCYHGVLLIINHVWRNSNYLSQIRSTSKVHFFQFLSWLITFLAVVMGWVLFRANNFATAINLYKALLGRHYFLHGSKALIYNLSYYTLPALLICCFMICLLLPNTVQYMLRTLPALNSRRFNQLYPSRNGINLSWKFSLINGVVIGLITYFALTDITHIRSEFLYFNF